MIDCPNCGEQVCEDFRECIDALAMKLQAAEVERDSALFRMRELQEEIDRAG